MFYLSWLTNISFSNISVGSCLVDMQSRIFQLLSLHGEYPFPQAHFIMRPFPLAEIPQLLCLMVAAIKM